MSAIVTNARSRIAYNVVRSLGKQNISVYSADSVARSMSFASRYSSGHFLYPSPYKFQDEFVRCIVNKIQELRADVLVPVFEETFLIAKHAASISKHVAMAIPSYEQILIAHNKDKWVLTARLLGIPVPESYSIEELLSGTTAYSDLFFPVLVKPKQGGGAWGIQQVNTSIELRALVRQDNVEGMPWNRFFVQQKIVGETHCVAMLFNNGQLRGKVAYRQLRDYPVTGGQATMRESVRSDQAEANLQQLLEHLKWHGVCQADFIVDKRTKIPYLIDMNPRLWGSVVQAIASGVDFPHMIYRLALDGEVAPVVDFRTGIVTRWLGGELGAFPSHLRRSTDRINFIRHFLNPTIPTTLFDDFSLSDPLPFLAWTADALHKALKFRSFRAVSHDSLAGIWE